MAPKPEREDLDTPRPRWVAWLIVIVMAMVVTVAGVMRVGRVIAMLTVCMVMSGVVVFLGF